MYCMLVHVDMILYDTETILFEMKVFGLVNDVCSNHARPYKKEDKQMYDLSHNTFVNANTVIVIFLYPYEM